METVDSCPRICDQLEKFHPHTHTQNVTVLVAVVGSPCVYVSRLQPDLLVRRGALEFVEELLAVRNVQSHEILHLFEVRP